MTIRYPLFSTFILSLVALCFATSVSALDDDAPEITARVARISVLKGNAQVRRKGATEWEKATLNFPLAEGDEIVLDDDARIEVQLDSKNYLRIGEKSRVVMTTLKDEGVAVSLMTGDLVLRIGSFDESKNFFEVDAPGTTVAVRARGLYRIDAGDASSDTVQLSVGDGGEARIYSDQSGFTVRDGRSAKLYLSGYRAGEWETLAADFSDKLSDWSEDRDKSIAKKLKNAYFGQYYDNDQFGAEDLTDYGDWVYTSQYGYVWRPYSNTTGYYRNWSPYRYGHWTWFPPYGWTWVNDEPWGWATYHHGRWIYLSSGWYWSPYASVRWSRSWWTPAFVTIAVYNGNVYWYPLGYYSRYYDYNCGYFGRSGRGGGGNRGGGNGGGNGNTYPFPNGGDRFKQKPIDRVPPSGVVAVDDKDFGRTRGGGKTAPPDVINQIVNGEKGTETWNKIEDYIPGGRRGGGDIAGDNATLRQLGPPVRTGAGQRTSGTALDSQLEKQVILQDRIPSRKPPVRVGGDPNDGDGSRGAGVLDRTTAPLTGGRFDRKPVDRESGNSDERGTTTTNNDGSTSSGGRYNQRPIDRTGGNNSSNGSNNTNNSSSPNGRFTPKPVDRSGGYNSGGSTTYNTQRKEEPPSTPSRKYDPPVRTSPPAPKYEPPVTRNPPERKYEPPVRNNPPAPKYEPPKSSPPSRSEPPRSSPPSRTPPSSDGGSTLQRKAPPKVPDDQ